MLYTPNSYRQNSNYTQNTRINDSLPLLDAVAGVCSFWLSTTTESTAESETDTAVFSRRTTETEVGGMKEAAAAAVVLVGVGITFCEVSAIATTTYTVMITVYWRFNYSRASTLKISDWSISKYSVVLFLATLLLRIVCYVCAMALCSELKVCDSLFCLDFQII